MYGDSTGIYRDATRVKGLNEVTTGMCEDITGIFKPCKIHQWQF